MKAAVLCLTLAVLSLAGSASGAANAQASRDDRPQVIANFLQASYARDYRTAYSYIAARDQRVWNQESYARRYGSLNGFALTLGQKLATGMEVWTIGRHAVASDRIRYDVGYRVPTADELSTAVYEW